MTADDNNFLSRWSRLKRTPGEFAGTLGDDAQAGSPEAGGAQVAVEGAAGEADVRSAPVAQPRGDTGAPADVAAPPPAGETDAPHPAELIDIDKLTKNSDFSAFVMKGVPAALQRKALRKLWTLDPVLANLDGLNDYENIIEDFGISDLNPGSTGWKIGRGFMTDEDFAEVNRRGGYLPPEEREADGEGAAEDDAPDEIASSEAMSEGGDSEGSESEAEDVAARSDGTSRQRDHAEQEDEFDVGGGDDLA